MAEGLPGAWPGLGIFPWLISTFTTQGVWLVIPISHLKKLRSER